MLATYVRNIRTGMQGWTDLQILELVDFLSEVLLIHQRQTFYVYEARLFRQIISKLESIEISLCLWLFVQSWKTRGLFDLRPLVEYMQACLYSGPESQDSWSSAAINVILLICSTSPKPRQPCLFFPDLHAAMVMPDRDEIRSRENEFHMLWARANREALYEDQVELMIENDRYIQASMFRLEKDRSIQASMFRL